MFRHTFFKRLGDLLIVCLLVTGSTVGAVAQDQATPELVSDSHQPSIAFYPSDQNQAGSINIELEPGDQGVIPIVLGNNGEVDFEAVTYAADAITMRNGGFSLLGLDSDPTGPTTWLNYPTEVFDTFAGRGIERNLEITVPGDALPGEYVTGIVMQTTQPVNAEATEGNFQLNQYYRTVIGIRILVPGELAPEITIGDPQYVIEGNVPGIVVPIVNIGNEQTSPVGEIRVSDDQGGVVLSAPVAMGPIYGGHETELWLGLGAPLSNGNYQISVELIDNNKGISADLSSAELVVINVEDTVIAEQSPISITSVVATPLPNSANIQFLQVDAKITNTDEPVANAQLSLIAKVNGIEVERFPISQSLSLPGGDTDVSTRYIPVTGWTSGEWEFELLLETVESSGAAVVVVNHPLDEKVTVP